MGSVCSFKDVSSWKIYWQCQWNTCKQNQLTMHNIKKMKTRTYRKNWRYLFVQLPNNSEVKFLREKQNMIFVIAVSGILPFSSIDYTKLAKKSYTYAKYPAVAPRYLWAAGKHSGHVDVSHEKQEGEPTEKQEAVRLAVPLPPRAWKSQGWFVREGLSFSLQFFFGLFLNWIRSLNPSPEQTEVALCWQKLILLILMLVFTWTVSALGGCPSWEFWTIFPFLINHHWRYSVKRTLGDCDKGQE